MRMQGHFPGQAWPHHGRRLCFLELNGTLLKAPTARVPWTQRHPDHDEDGAVANEGRWRRDRSSSFKSLAATYRVLSPSWILANCWPESHDTDHGTCKGWPWRTEILVTKATPAMHRSAEFVCEKLNVPEFPVVPEL
jgi:hypothetical protein